MAAISHAIRTSRGNSFQPLRALRLLAALVILPATSSANDTRANDLLHVENCRLVDRTGPVKAIGVNYVDGFWDYAKNGKRESYLPALDALADAKVPFIRMAFGPWASSDLSKPTDPAINYFINNRDLYFKRLDIFIRDAKDRHIRLVLDVFWNVDPYLKYFNEKPSAWQDSDSRTVRFLTDTLIELASRHGKDPEILLIEFFNEGNLFIDYPNAPHTRTELISLFNTLVSVMRTHEDEHIIETGNSLPRPAASHLNKHDGWSSDSKYEFLQALEAENSSEAKVASIHLYPEFELTRTYDHGNILNVLPILKIYEKKDCRPIFIGEFGAEDENLEQLYIKKIVQSDIQLAAIWGFERPAGRPFAFGIDAKGRALLSKLHRH